LVVLVEVLIGSILGGLAGFYGGIVDGIIMRIVDIFLCFSGLPLLIMFAAVMSDLKVPPQYRMYVVMFLIGILGWPGLCRIVRAQILSTQRRSL
jgi:peptide/nickel transport system permease protein